MTEHAKLASVDDVRKFMLAGNAIFTLRSRKTQNRFTFKVQAPKGERSEPAFYFVNVLTGANNESDYSYLGHIRGPYFQHGRNSRISRHAISSIAFYWFARNILGKGRLPDSVEVWHEGRCGRCGRPLTVPESIAAGLGPDCADRMGA